MRLLLILLPLQMHIGKEAVALIPLPSQSVNLVIASNSSPEKPSQSLCPAQLGVAIESVTNRSQFSRGRWGILIQNLYSSDTLYSHDSEKYFVPASNVKLLTTAATLHQLGANFKIRTSVYGARDNDLYVVGRGDPSLTDSQLKDLTQQLRQRGIRQVRQLIPIDNYFRGAAINPSWEWEDVQADYGAPVNSLILNQNAAQLRLLPQQIGQPVRVNWIDPLVANQWQIQNESITVKSDEPTAINVSQNLKDSGLKITGQIPINSQSKSFTIAVIDPDENFWRHFYRALIAEGIVVNADKGRSTQISKPLSIRQRLSAVELATVTSPPLAQLLVETNQNSNNLYAESLLRTLGATAGNIFTTNPTDEVGLQVVKAVLTKLGVEPTGYLLADGSGLSRHNLVSPAAIAQTLQVMARSPLAQVYRASLPTAGVSGTLQNRLRNSAAQGIVQAKTGSMSGVAALSGYLDPPNYEPLVFSIIVNQSDQPAATLRQAIDEIVLLLTRLRSCGN